MHVMGHMMGGGVEATVMNYYRHIDHARVQFDFVVDSDSTVVPREEIEHLGGRIFVVPPYRQIPRYLRACEALFRREKPDIVHSNINALSVFPLAAAKRAGVPIRIAHSHSTADPKEYKKTFIKNVLKHYSRMYPTHLAACSQYSARWLFGDRTVDMGKVHIVKNAIDLDEFAFNSKARAIKRGELGAYDGQLVIGQVGRMCFQKNQLFVLDVFADVLKRRPEALLVFAGDGELTGSVRAKAHKLGLEKSIRFLGIRDDVHALYQAFDVLVFPSTYEGLGMAAIEAQASGLAVLSSDRVPDEVRVVERLVRMIPLTSPELWVDALCAHNIVGTRASEIGALNAAGYDIAESAEVMCRWYEILADASKDGR
jgi:glycosyltransferase involved in cell wall biosynthesis